MRQERVREGLSAAITTTRVPGHGLGTGTTPPCHVMLPTTMFLCRAYWGEETTAMHQEIVGKGTGTGILVDQFVNEFVSKIRPKST